MQGVEERRNSYKCQGVDPKEHLKTYIMFIFLYWAHTRPALSIITTGRESHVKTMSQNLKEAETMVSTGVKISSTYASQGRDLSSHSHKAD